jgi:hypothetical protein
MSLAPLSEAFNLNKLDNSSKHFSFILLESNARHLSNVAFCPLVALVSPCRLARATGMVVSGRSVVTASSGSIGSGLRLLLLPTLSSLLRAKFASSNLNKFKTFLLLGDNYDIFI